MFFKKKKKEIVLLPKPREQHYIFAHRAIRDIALNNPFQFFDIMFSQERDAYLDHVWNLIIESSNSGQIDFETKATRVTTVRIKGHPSTFIMMPEPKAIGEAYMLGIVLNQNYNQEADALYFSVEYFTLELGQKYDGRLSTYLCKWDFKNNCTSLEHLNLGNGSKPKIEEFIFDIERFITKKDVEAVAGIDNDRVWIQSENGEEVSIPRGISF